MKFKFTWMLTLFLALVQFSFAQEKNISGTVSDESGMPLPGVAVLVKGTSSGTQTDFDGKYSLKALSGQTLVFSYLGMKSVEKIVGNATVIDVILKEDAQALEEVVVTGVGAATDKRKVAIAVQTVSDKALSKVPVTSIDQALTGKIAGAQISSTSGQPGQQASIMLRGINTLGTTQPMILVDGVQVNAGNNNNGSGTNLSSRLADLDLTNVERVEVVQGAAAATIYGAQGANGVIQIFTKKGKKGDRTSVTFKSKISSDYVLTGNLEKANNHFFNTDSEGFILDNLGNRLQPDVNGLWPEPNRPSINGALLNNKPYREKTYDHIGQLFKNGSTSLNNSVNISGGSELSDYSINLSDVRQQSIINGDLNRTNVSVNLGTELFKNFTMRSTTQLIFSTNTTGGINGQNNIMSGVGTALTYMPYWDMKFQTPEGYYVSDPSDNNSVNPFYSFQFRNYKATNSRIVQGFDFDYKINKFVQLNYKFGYDTYRYDFTDFIKYQFDHPNPSGGLTPGNGKITYDQDKETLQNSLLTMFIKTNFEDDFGWNIPIQTTTHLAYDYRSRNYKNITTSGTGFSPFPPYNLNTAETKSNSESNLEFVTFGYLINQKIDYGNLFGLSGGVRVDYSSAFGAGNDPFVFPRGDVYFRVGELIKKDFLREFKLRAAYGEAGIQPGAYDRFITLSSANIGGSGALVMPDVARNPNLQVQLSKETEFGTDLGFILGGNWFRNINLGATYWQRTSEDVIRALDLAPSTGTPQVLDNALSFSSKGLEISLDVNMFESENFAWNMGARFGMTETIVDEIANGKDIVIGSGGSGQFVIREGVSLGAFFGKTPLTSLSQLNPEGDRYIPEANAGDYELVNGMIVNKNTKAVQFTSDQTMIGDPNPDFTLAVTNNFSIYKNLNVSFQFEAVVGNDVYNQTKQFMYRDLIHGDLDKSITVGGETGPFVNYYNSLYLTNSTNSYFVEDGSFVRLRDLSLSYDLTSLLDSNVIKNASVTFSGRNLFTISNYAGMDPEAAAAINNPLRRGLDLYSFPNFRTYQVGISVGF